MMSKVAMCSKTIPILKLSLILGHIGFIDDPKRFLHYDFDWIQPKHK